MINIGNNLVKNCLSYNISKFRRKLINICRDTIIFRKYVDVIILQIRILTSKAIMMTSRCIEWPNGDMKSYLRLILYLNMTKNGSPYSSRCTFDRHVFAHICYVIHEIARTDIYLQRTLIPLLIVIKIWHGIKLFRKIWGISCQKKLRGNYFSFGRDERKRAKNTCFARFFMKCL